MKAEPNLTFRPLFFALAGLTIGNLLFSMIKIYNTQTSRKTDHEAVMTEHLESLSQFRKVLKLTDQMFNSYLSRRQSNAQRTFAIPLPRLSTGQRPVMDEVIRGCLRQVKNFPSKHHRSSHDIMILSDVCFAAIYCPGAGEDELLTFFNERGELLRTEKADRHECWARFDRNIRKIDDRIGRILHR